MSSTKIEALTAAQRMKAKATFRKNKSKIAMGRKKAEKRVASPEKLRSRAQKAARKEVEKKILKDKSKNDLSFAARQALEKKVDKKKSMVDRLAKRMLPKLKKAELERKRGPKKEDVSEKLSASMPVTDWIDDFIKSDAPQFQGKSKKERIDMALAAHRSAQKEATNPVAKHAHKFNKSVAHKDKKKEQKKGYVKHKNKEVNQ